MRIAGEIGAWLDEEVCSDAIANNLISVELSYT
jgi:hypothetical protein